MQHYSRLQIILHWATAALVLLSLAFGTLILQHLPNDVGKITPLRVHMIAGGAIGLLIVVRLIVRLTTPQPDRVKTGNSLLDRLAVLNHGAMYVGVIVMVSSGIALALQAGLPAVIFGHAGAAIPADFGQYPPRFVHGLFAKFLIALVGLHFAAALFHQFVRKDRTLSRMWFARS
ncbi:MAG TPA: cytochrome b/b6 domain-containing protein [Bradyrhizobium sp.]|nr:cytochrome b/b6 domain-containing protein [Bradyrhizobium sp.]